METEYAFHLHAFSNSVHFSIAHQLSMFVLFRVNSVSLGTKKALSFKECPRIKTRFMTNILSPRLNIVITCLYINMHMVEGYGTSLPEKLTNEEQCEQWAVYSTTEEQRMLRFWKVTFYLLCCVLVLPANICSS